MKKRALLLVTTSYPQSGDGSEAAGSFVQDFAEVLSKRVPVRIVAPGGIEVGPEHAGGIEVWRFAGGGRPLSLLKPSSPFDWPRILRVLASMQRQAHAAAADGSVQHVLALWVLPSGWMALDLFRKRGIPYSVWALGSDIWTLGRIPLVARALRRVIRGASSCHADGYRLAADAAGIGGRPFQFLPSGRKPLVVDARPVRGSPPWTLLFLGRWHPNKGIDLLLEALEELPGTAWAAIGEITIAGGGPLHDLVHGRVARLAAAQRPIRLLGFLDREAAAAEIIRADWLVIPSRIESIPVILSDALKCGRPVIVTPVGDMRQVVEANLPCGIVAADASSGSIAAAIAEAVTAGPAGFAEGIRRSAAIFDLDAATETIIGAMSEQTS